MAAAASPTPSSESPSTPKHHSRAECALARSAMTTRLPAAASISPTELTSPIIIGVLPGDFPCFAASGQLLKSISPRGFQQPEARPRLAVIHGHQRLRDQVRNSRQRYPPTACRRSRSRHQRLPAKRPRQILPGVAAEPATGGGMEKLVAPIQCGTQRADDLTARFGGRR